MTDAPATTEALSVGELARLAGVTVRTLHHYDEIGLLRPSERGSSGRRVYSAADAARLGRILGYRALELPLETIAELLGGGTAADEAAQLRHQLELLDERIARLTRIRDHVLTTLEAHTMNIDLTPAERLEVFGDDDPAQYAAEAHERWGHTDAYHESAARTKRYGKDDWLRIKAESEAIESAFAAALAAGEPADGAVAMDLAERARLHITSTFYDCSPAMHRGLADMYVADPRFTAHYERRAAGLAQYVRDAIHANADRTDAAPNG